MNKIAIFLLLISPSISLNADINPPTQDLCPTCIDFENHPQPIGQGIVYEPIP